MNKTIILAGSFYRIMKASFIIILQLIFMLEVISVGCRSGHRDNTESAEAINQIDSYGNRQGLWMIYSDSVLAAKGTYVNGKPAGLWTYYYKNGQIKEEGHYKHGTKDGMWAEWYPDGDIMWKGEWIHGKREIEYAGSEAKVTVMGQDNLPRHLLAAESVYSLKIRIQNIPSGNLFVEVSSGSITREDESDIFILNTSSDTNLTMAVGYIPDLEFKDFRNLVSEIQFKIR
jgi:hypothetical protein